MPRRLIVILAIALIAGPIVGAAPVAADGPTVDQLKAAEARVEQLINRQRDTRGKRPFRHDSRVATLARAKSRDMVERNYFDHRDTRGRYVDDHLRRAGIRFSRVGEIIAWGRSGDLPSSAGEAVHMWMHSAPHRRLILSDNVYFGAGVASNGHTWKWTVIFITAADRTPPTSRFTPTVAASGEVALRWTGYDPLLVKGTAGLRGFDLERRAPEGAWQRVRTVTTSRSYTSVQPSGTLLEFRLRARDRNGNVGRWTEPLRVLVT